jgi:hypothetical protein
MSKVAISMALVAAAAADTTVNAEFGTTKIEGATTTQGNVTQGDWKISGEHDGKQGSEQVSYIVSGDKDDKDNRMMIKETIKKFDQFFFYAMDAKNLKLGSEEKQCQLDSQCGDEGESTKCCVSAVFRNKDDQKQHELYRCMNKAVAKANMDLTMNDHSISMRCQESGAAYIAATFAASAATLAAYTLY